MSKSKSYECTGILHVKGETEAVTGSFSKREFVVKIEDSQFPQFVKMQLVQDRCELLEGYHVGQEITVHFDLRGKETNGRYWTNLNAWKLSAIVTPPAPEKQPEPLQTATVAANPEPPGDVDPTQLPF